MRSQFICLLLLPLLALGTSSTFINTSSWLGTGYYAPSPSPDNLGWWSFYERYRPAVVRELPLLRPTLGINTLRVFLHTLVFEKNATALLVDLEDFLTLAHAAELRVGLVLFGSGPQGNASTTTRCEPRKGLSNGCWKASPQNVDETSIDRYKAYVEGIVGAHATDARIAFFELANEPVNNTFWNSLRDAAFVWASALRPVAPIISCWLDNRDSELVDVHVYSDDFASMWAERIYLNESKGALVTEGGGRWTEIPTVATPEDSGSPLSALNFLRALHVHEATPVAPFIPGVLFGWEAVIGNSYSRYYWGSKLNAPEMHVPWLGMLWPEGTPVSFTEAAAMREYATGAASTFLAFDKFLDPTLIRDGNSVLAIAAGSNHTVRGKGGAPYTLTDALVEVALRPEVGSTASIFVRAASRTDGSFDGYAIHISTSNKTLWIERIEGGTGVLLGSPFSLSARENGLCVGCYNLLRIIVKTQPDSRARVSVWFNVMYTDVGFLNDDEDALRIPHAPLPLIDIVDDAAAPLPAGTLIIASAGAAVSIDYAAALPV